MSENSFCLDFGEKLIRVVEARLKGNLIDIGSFGSAESVPFFFGNDSEKFIDVQAETISNLCGALKIKKKSVNVVIPDSFSYSHIIEVPKLNEKELQSAIRYQADQFIPMPLDDISLDIEVIKEDQKLKKSQVLLVASPKKIISQIERTIEYAGLYPESLENEFSVIRRLFFEMSKSPQTVPSLLINIGYSTSSIYLIDQKTSTLLPRTVKIGLELFIKDIKLNLNVDEKKALEFLQTIGFADNASVNLNPYIDSLMKELAIEINKFLVLAKDSHNLNIGQILLFNYNSYIAGIEKKIQSLIPITTASLTLKDYLTQNSISNSFLPVSSSFVGAVCGSIR